MFLIYIIILTSHFLNSEEYVNEIKLCQEKLSKVLRFIDENYYEFNFDGLFGIILAQAQLMKIGSFNVTHSKDKAIEGFIDKCHLIKLKVLPLLPTYPTYMITFNDRLLNEHHWETVIETSFVKHRIRYLPYYKNWSAESIIHNKAAIYKGVKTDVCLQEILSRSKPKKPCHISPICREMMLDPFRVDTGYLLTHRLLYILIIQLQQCVIQDQFWTKDDYINFFCAYIYREAKTSEFFGYPYHDIFLEQVLLCGLVGVAEFLNDKWMYKILEWQNSHGCYESIGKSKLKRTSNIIEFGCSDHTTGLAAATIALYLRYYITKLQCIEK